MKPLTTIIRTMLLKMAQSVIRFYQLAISPYLPNTCRHQPTCSSYALIALKKHGPAKGAWLTLKRLLRCHPLSTKGHDPVPD